MALLARSDGCKVLWPLGLARGEQEEVWEGLPGSASMAPLLPQRSGPGHHEVIFPLCVASWTLYK